MTEDGSQGLATGLLRSRTKRRLRAMRPPSAGLRSSLIPPQSHTKIPRTWEKKLEQDAREKESG